MNKEISFTLNGKPVTATVPVDMKTVTMLRDVLGLTGTKESCGEGECGSCTILVDGTSVLSCLLFAVECDGREVTTVEGLLTEKGKSILQQEFINHGAVQCGFCTPGMLMQGTYLLRRNPDMSEEEIKRGIEGNLCRCTGYRKVIDAIASAVKKIGRSEP